MEEIFENHLVKFWVEDDIIYCFYKSGSIITLESAREFVSLRLKAQNGRIFKGLSFYSNILAVTPEAKEYLSNEGYQGVSKVAMVANNPIKVVIGNLFIKVTKTIKPTRLFINQEAALKWLREN